jgi:hypothetical protein
MHVGPCMDSDDVSCEQSTLFLRSVEEHPDDYLETSVFSELPRCMATCDDTPCPIRDNVNSIIMDARVVILILGMTVETMYNGTIRGFIERDFNGVHLFRELDMTADGVVIICYDTGNDRMPTIRHAPAGHVVIGLNGLFDTIVRNYPVLEGRCDIVLNDYSTAKFFRDNFHHVLSSLLTRETGFALLQDIVRRAPVLPYQCADMEISGEPRDYNISLMNGRIIQVQSSVSARLAQVLYQAQIVSGTIISRNASVICSGRRITAEDMLYNVHIDSTLSIVTPIGQHYIEPYEDIFNVYPMTGYPIVHYARVTPTGVWMLTSRD